MQEIENKHYKECSVVMLPAKDKTDLFLDGKDLIYQPNSNIHFKDVIYQNLYIINDDKIKEGNWYLYYMNLDGVPELMKCRNNEESDRCNDKTRNIGQISFKIIATTDKSLRKPSGEMYPEWDYLHQLPQSFIKKYCEQGDIKKVLVEYEYKLVGNYELKDKKSNNLLIPKTDSHNTITIKSVKNYIYSKQKVEDLLEEIAMESYIHGLKVGSKQEKINVDSWNAKDWIKENL